LSAAELGFGSGGELEELLTLGGFPEPFLGGSELEARRWSREFRTLIVREEVTSLERVRDLGQLELLMLRLPELVGSPPVLEAHSAQEGWEAWASRNGSQAGSEPRNRTDTSCSTKSASRIANAG
jgi:hypothetical protein